MDRITNIMTHKVTEGMSKSYRVPLSQPVYFASVNF